MCGKRVRSRPSSLLAPIAISAAVLGHSLAPVKAADTGFRANKEYDELTAAGKAAFEKKSLGALRVCGDPGNMPLSASDGGGFQNKIMAVLAKALGAGVINFWRPYLERGITRQTFETNDCDVLVDMPTTYG